MAGDNSVCRAPVAAARPRACLARAEAAQLAQESWGGQSCPQPAFSHAAGGAGLNNLWLVGVFLGTFCPDFSTSFEVEKKGLDWQPQASRLDPLESRFRFQYQYSSCQLEYSRNLRFRSGYQMWQVLQSLIGRTRGILNLKVVKTIFGFKTGHGSSV